MDRNDVHPPRANAVYEGFRGPQPGYGHGGPLVVGVREGEQKRTLTPIESDAAFEWGYDGAGPAHLAEAILDDRLGFAPPGAIGRAFTRDVIAKLPSDFELLGTSVDAWLTDPQSW